MSAKMRFKPPMSIVGAVSCGAVQAVTAPLYGHPMLSWRLAVALALGAVAGLVISVLADKTQV